MSDGCTGGVGRRELGERGVGMKAAKAEQEKRSVFMAVSISLEAT